MSEVGTLLRRLREAGIRVWLEDGRVRYRAPKGAMTAARLAVLRERQVELADWLARPALESIARLPDRESYEASHAQRRLWILHQFDPASAAYNVPLHQRLDGPLDRAALEAAVAALFARHEALRTRFVPVDGEPRQVVEPAVQVPLAYRDLSALADPDEAARGLGREHAAAPFDLEAGPLVRLALLRLAEERHVLLMTAHHIVVDGTSVRVIARDLARLYEGARGGEPLPPLAVHYRDFAAWQNRMLEGDRGRVHREHWHQALAAPIPVLDLVDDLPRPPVMTVAGREIVFELPAAVTAGLVALGRRRRASLFMVLVAALTVLLHRETGQADVVVGTPSAGRSHPDLEDQVGLYLNTLALRNRVEPDMTFEALLDQVRTTATEAFEHQDYPFERLVEELGGPRDLSRSPLFDVMVILENLEDPPASFGGLTARPVFEHTDTAKLDLTFSWKETPRGLVFGIEYRTDVFVEARIRHMAARLSTLLHGIVANPDERVGRLTWLSAAERHRVLHEFNATAVEYSGPAAAIDWFEAQARATPTAPAALHRGRTLTYRALDALANRIARHLGDRHGFRPGDAAGLAVPTGFDMLAALLATMKLRGAAVPIDPTLPVARWSLMLAESGARVLIVDSRPDGLDFAGAIVELDVERGAIEALAADRVEAGARAADDTVIVVFTSGSMGRPKGVPLTNRGIVNELHWFRDYFGVGPADVLAQKTVVTFVDAIVELLLPVTLAGGAVFLRPDEATARDFAALFAWLSEIRPTILQFVPAVFDHFVADHDVTALASLRALILSGGVVSRRPPYPFRVYNLYGCSECTSLSTAHDMTGPGPLARVPIGRPLANTTVAILDERGEPCPVFVPGEMYVGGAMVARGYLGDPGPAPARFVPSPFRPGERLFRTGDVARWLPDGTVDFLGRRDGQVKVRGVRVECGEVERALREHPAVREAAVVGRATADGDTELLAYVVGAVRVETGELRRHLGRSLPDAMVPAHVVFLDALPRTSSGKIDRRALPDPGRVDTASAPRVPPRDDLEATIATAWAEILGVADAGIHDDFLTQGGGSLKATRLAARLRRALDVPVGAIDVFRHPTIAALGDLVRSRHRGSADEIRPVDDVAPPTGDELAMLQEDIS